MRLHRSDDTPPIICRRNRGGFLVGASWVHDPAWSDGFRLTHLYLGWFVLTVRTVTAVPTDAAGWYSIHPERDGES